MSLFHRHRWQVMAVQHGHSPGGYCATCVLLVCACGEFTSKSVEGHWTVEDLTGKLGQADQEFLKRIGVK
jgi:hypothetical protein